MQVPWFARIWAISDYSNKYIFRRKNHKNDLGHSGGLAQWLATRTKDKGVPCSSPGRVAVRCGLEQVTFTPCLVLEAVGVRLTWTDCDEAGDYVVPYVLRDPVSSHDNMDETVLHTDTEKKYEGSGGKQSIDFQLKCP